MSLLFVDAYDSFSQNVVALLKQELDAKVTLIRIDTDVVHRFGTTLDNYIRQFDAIVVGPGPGNPNDPKDVGLLYDLFDAAACWRIPVLGICLGFQVLCIKYGLRVARMSEPCHGQAKKILYYLTDSASEQDYDIFNGLDLDNIWATCYNSLGLILSNALSSPETSRPTSSGTNSSLASTSSNRPFLNSNANFRVLAVDREDNVMAIKHQYLPFWGVQFHPESCKSNSACRQLVRNWSSLATKYSSRFALSHMHDALERDQAAINSDGLDTKATEYRQHRTPASLGLDVADTIKEHLSKVSSSTCNTVNWRRLQATCSRVQISELIHDLSSGGNIAMLESTKKGRFSIYAVLSSNLFANESASSRHTAWRAQYQDSVFSVNDAGTVNHFEITASREDVWTGLESLVTFKRATGGSVDIPFWGGFIGYLSYEHGLDTLEVESQGPTRSVPDISLVWVERSIVHDNLTNTIYVQSIRQNDEEFVGGMTTLLSTPSSSWSRTSKQATRQRSMLRDALNSTQIVLPDHIAYDSKFHACQSQLRAGNSYELCLTTEAAITIPKATSPQQSYDFALYQNLHAHNPVPFGAYLKLSPITILSTSPEQYISWTRDGVIDMIPMKGTVKRSPTMTLAKASSILSSAKESAENLMIADLIRHDLYSALGSDSQVEVIKLCEVIEHETVYQLVSHIRAHAPIPTGSDADETQSLTIHHGLNALRQTVPPGSMTGAPKMRSCEILAGLEHRNRGVYSGVLGYMDVGGAGSWSVCIRTAFRHDDEGPEDRDVWRLGAGGAITVLSDAEGEWQEMVVKLDSVLKGFKEVAGEVAV